MKTIKFILISFLVVGFVACEDSLDTSPSVNQGKEVVFATVDNGFVALNGIYRSMYSSNNWTDNIAAQTENFGQKSVDLAAELMGEDMIQYDSGSGWFWFDYIYLVRTEYANTSERPYVWWNMYYTWIANCNYIIAYAKESEGSESNRNSLIGQAYALRAYSYFYLAQFYQRTYIGNENAPGVPIYTAPTTNETKGAPRGTLKDTYLQINKDLDKAIELLANASAQKHISHIDYYVANGIKARVALVQREWEVAEKAATEALKKPELRLMSEAELLSGFNSKDNAEWMWGAEVIPSQSTTWFSFFGHIDATANYHATTAQKCVSSWLYDRINDNDIRKSWFNGALNTQNPQPWEVDYCQQKFRDSSTNLDGDLLYMRMAEMYLILAEARCQQNNFSGARQALSDLISYKFPDYNNILVARIDSKDLSFKSTESIGIKTLMDEIILQRRIELWGEGFRILDIMRLKTGFIRNYPGTNHTHILDISNPDSWEWIMMIPQKEFDGNTQMDPEKDQNPEKDSE
jgi:hypothetical protein